MTENPDSAGSPQDAEPATLHRVLDDWRILDTPAFQIPPGIRLIAHEKFVSVPEIRVEFAPREGIVAWTRAVGPLSDALYALRLLHKTRPGTVLLLDGRQRVALMTAFFNSTFCRRRRITLNWGCMVEVDRRWKRAVMRRVMKGMTLSLLWSRAQISAHSRFLELPEGRFAFIPYKANHSKGVRYDYPPGNFVFSGGNGKRDYASLAKAVEGTGIPLMISATDPAVRRSIPRLSNVMVLAAGEPAFAQLQAASRFVVVPMVHTGLKGGGEANFCNAMWHGKPVIAADSIAASDYIIDGVTGYVVPSGDIEGLRRRIIELWEDREKAAEMGRAARLHVEANYTHVAFIRRLLRLALILGRDHAP